MDLSIRDFTEDDRVFFLESCMEFYSSPAVNESVPIENFKHTFDICLKGGPYIRGVIFWVGEYRAGYGLISFTYCNEVGGLSVLLEEAYIAPEYQGLGIGPQFFKMGEDHYIKAGKAKRLRLEVTKVNTGAIQLYEKMGYKPLNYIQMVKDYGSAM